MAAGRNGGGFILVPTPSVATRKNVAVCRVPIQVKQKEKAGRPDIDSFEAMMMREDREKGFFVSFDFTADALAEIGFFRRSGKVIVPLTVREILDEQIAMKLA
jgi:hypothetical protein